jgi:hypothetical protein
MELPDGYDPADIDVNTIAQNGVLPAMASPTSVGDYDADVIADRMVKFSSNGLIAFLEVAGESRMWSGESFEGAPVSHGGQVEVDVRWELHDGTVVVGRDGIKVIIPPDGGQRGSAALVVMPTPLTGTASFSCKVDVEGPMTLSVYDVAGRLVRTLDSGYASAGTYEIT